MLENLDLLVLTEDLEEQVHLDLQGLQGQWLREKEYQDLQDLLVLMEHLDSQGLLAPRGRWEPLERQDREGWQATKELRGGLGLRVKRGGLGTQDCLDHRETRETRGWLAN